MKLSLLFLILLSLPVCGWGQTLDTGFLRPSITATDSPAVTKTDTISIWFKEIKFIQYRCILCDKDTAIERWVHGYKIIQTLPTYHFVSDTRIEYDTQEMGYLYADRKTKVTNYVIYSISNK